MIGRYQVLGCKGFKGDVEGKHYDSTTLYVVFPVSRRADGEVGFNVKAVKFGLHDEFLKLKELTFPLLADLDLEHTSKDPECYGFKAVAQQPKPNGQTA